MIEKRYIFSDNQDWLNLVSACVPLDNHDNSPSKYILGILVSNLHDPISLSDARLVNELLDYIGGIEHTDKIMNCAVTLYVNMINELNAMNIGGGKSYFLISAELHVTVGMYFLT